MQNPNDGWEDGDGNQEVLPPAAAPVQPVTGSAPALNVGVVAVQEPVGFPSDMKACYKLLAEFEALPTKSGAQEKAREAKLAPLRKHIFDLQQGNPVVHMGADQLHAGHHTHNALLKRQRLEEWAKSDHTIKEFLAAYDALEKECDALSGLNDQFNALSAEAKTAMDALNTKFEAVTVERGVLITERDALKAGNESLQAQVASLITERDALKAIPAAPVVAAPEAKANVPKRK